MLAKTKLMSEVLLLASNIESASVKMQAYEIVTPCYKSTALSRLTGAEVYLKCEHLQKTGSFKFRGALNKLLSLGPEEKSRGVVAASSGNHGRGVAYAAALLGIDATIFLPQNASETKIQAIKDIGAKIIFVEGECFDAEEAARAHSVKSNQVFISPYNDTRVMTGQGTIGHEMHNQVPNLDAVFVSVGGGGLIGGIGSYLKQLSPSTKIIGCWPKNSPVMYEALNAGNISTIPEEPTLSDGTAGQVEDGSITFPICQAVIDEKTLVTEDEIKEAMKLIAKHENFIIEGAAAVAVSSFLKTKDKYQGKKVVLVLCGRNINLETFINAVK